MHKPIPALPEIVGTTWLRASHPHYGRSWRVRSSRRSPNALPELTKTEGLPQRCSHFYRGNMGKHDDEPSNIARTSDSWLVFMAYNRLIVVVKFQIVIMTVYNIKTP